MKREIEARGQDVESAIETGIKQLGVNRADVIVEVIDEGSRGLLGIGSRDAVVRLTSMQRPAAEPPKPKPKPQPVVPPPQPKATAVTPPKVEATVEKVADVKEEKATAVTDEDVAESLANEQEVAIDIVQTLLAKMQVQATIETNLSEPDEITGRQIVKISVNGDDLSSLIGPRGDTLYAMQYIARLMASHRLHRRTYFVIDVAGYRERREQALTRLAERMGDKVAIRKRAISLEPMPPHERRIIHMTLRNSEDVYTESVGEGKRRKVRIYPH